MKTLEVSARDAELIYGAAVEKAGALERRIQKLEGETKPDLVKIRDSLSKQLDDVRALRNRAEALCDRP